MSTFRKVPLATVTVLTPALGNPLPPAAARSADPTSTEISAATLYAAELLKIAALELTPAEKRKLAGDRIRLSTDQSGTRAGGSGDCLGILTADPACALRRGDTAICPQGTNRALANTSACKPPKQPKLTPINPDAIKKQQR